MKRISVILFALVLCVACAAPKYTYNFDYYDYNSGKKKTEQVVTSAPQAEVNPSHEVSPLKLSPSEITANVSADPVPVPFRQTETTSTVSSTNEPVSGKDYRAMSRDDRKAFRKTVKKALKEQVKAIKNGDHIAVNEADRTMDLDLKYAILFGAVGLALALFGGINEVFSILGVISILVGIYFLIKWLIRQ